MNEILLTLSRSIKEKKWLQIKYKNLQNEVTKYWIGIHDISDDKRLIVDALRYGNIDDDIKRLNIYVESILEATLIESTYYPQNKALIEKIESNHLKYHWLDYFKTDHEVLEYYKLCALEDTDLEERNYHLLQGFDEFQVTENKFVLTNPTQIATIYKMLSKQAFNASEERPLFSRLSMNLAAIKSTHGIRPVLYRDVRLNLNEKTLVIGSTIRINTTYKTEQATSHIKNYIGMEVKDYLALYQVNPTKALDVLEENLNYHEMLDTSPYLAVFQKSMSISLEKEFQQISKSLQENTLSKSLYAFFGKLGKINRRSKKDYPIFLTTEKINFDQLRGVYNAINQDITYIQGPPGTGKTHMIKEVAISSLFNDRTMLIVSNNNQAIEQIYSKLNGFRYQNKPIPFISLRLGNYEKTQEALDTIKREYLNHKKIKLKPEEKKLQNIKDKILNSLSKTNNQAEAYEQRIMLEEKLEDLLNIQKISFKKLLPESIQEEILTIQNELKSLPKVTEDSLIKGVKVDDQLLSQFLYFSSIKRLMMLDRESNEDLLSIILSTDAEKQVELFNTWLSNNDNLERFLKIFPIVITTNLSAGRLGDATVHFDLMIMDEAGQCQVANSLIPMARADRALFVGDHKQLQPVITLDPSKNEELMKAFHIHDYYDYVNNSILKCMRRIDTKSLNILLRKHYRSHHAIIEFSNQKYYGGKLIFDKSKSSNAIEVINIDNKKDNVRNLAIREISEVIQLIKRKEFETDSIGVITPFRNQANEISKVLQEQGYHQVKVGTVHTFQGGEKDHIIFSTALTQNTSPHAASWAIHSEELVNVAVTRAKKKFTMVCDVEAIKGVPESDHSDLYELYQYIAKKGKESVSQNSDILDNFIRTDDTYSEKEFYETLAHYTTTQNNLRIGKKEFIKDVLTIDKKSAYYQYSLSSHFDFVLYSEDKPIMVFEIDGNEHEMIDKRKISDFLKQSICDHYKLKLNHLTNHQTRRYDLVVDFINQNKN